MTTQADPTPGDWLLAAGQQYPGVRCCHADRHPLLMSLAQAAAELQARRRRCGHQGWDGRYRRILAEVRGVKTASEIAAQSWPWEADAPLLDVGLGMFKSWEQSRGHWATASTEHRYVGAWMARSRRGIWYATIIVAD